MPRLIKLASDQETVADFQAFFTEDIIIKPNSKVALLNLSLTLNKQVFEVDLSNCDFRVQCKGGGPPGGLKAATLKLGTYDEDAFIAELTRAINTVFSVTDMPSRNAVSNYIEWKPVMTDIGKLKIQYSATAPDTNSIIPLNAGKFSFTANILSKAGTDSLWESCYTTTIFNNGVGEMWASLTAVDDGVCIGLISDLTNGNLLTPTDFYISVFINAGVYKCCINGAVITSIAIPQVNDLIFVRKSNGTLSVNFQRGNAVTMLGSLACDYTTLLHGAISFLNNANRITNVNYVPSPFQVSNVNGVSLINDIRDIQHANYLNFDNLGATATYATQHRLLLTASSALLLGFNTLDNADLAIITGSFNGDNIIRFGKLAESLTIELPSLALEGYDSDIHRRRSILHILPAGEVPSVQRDYSAIYPIFIDINNKFEQSLNTFHVRILDEGGVPVQMEPGPGCILTVLLD